MIFYLTLAIQWIAGTSTAETSVQRDERISMALIQMWQDADKPHTNK